MMLVNDLTKCQSESYQCFCLLKETGLSFFRFVFNPRNRAHLALCFGQTGLCTLTGFPWLFGSRIPILSRWKSGFIAICISIHQALTQWEKDMFRRDQI